MFNSSDLLWRPSTRDRKPAPALKPTPMSTSDRPPSPSEESRARWLQDSPPTPGVYWMLDRNSRILYVGKAVNIRERLRTHLRATGRLQKVQRNLSRVRDIRWMVTGTEAEALILEESLIREHHPPFNIIQPNFRFLCVTLAEEFPRFMVVRNMSPGDGNAYFGPYSDRLAMDRLFHSLQPVFRIRGDESRCGWNGQGERSACYQFELGWCSAPCQRMVDSNTYGADAELLAGALRGSEEKLVETLASAAEKRLHAASDEAALLRAESDRIRKAMDAACRTERFEVAADLRDELVPLERKAAGALQRATRLRKQYAGLRRPAEMARVVQPDLPDMDVWALAGQGDRLALVILPYRSGRLGTGLQAKGTVEEIGGLAERYLRRRASPPGRVVILGAGAAEQPALAGIGPSSLLERCEALFARVATAVFPEAATEVETDRCRWPAAADLACMNARSLLESRQRRNAPAS